MIRRLLGAIDSISNRTGWIFCPFVIIIVVIIAIEVVSRYVFNAPTIWANELAQHFFAFYIMIGGAYALLYETHAKVDILYQRLSPRKQAILDCVTYCLLFFFFTGVLLWQGTALAWLSTVRNQGTASLWNSPIWPARWGLVVATSLIMLQGVAILIRKLNLAITGRQDL